jgi:UDP-N-acetylmuramoylalanine--D-glutamate ligase
MNSLTYTIVVGLGKTGFSCVRYLVQQGYSVAVVDSRNEPPCLAEFHKLCSDNNLSIPLALGTFAAPFLMQARELVVSPGVSLREPELVACIVRGVPVIGDIELLVRAVAASATTAHGYGVPIVAITGSNGKSTVTTLVGEMAKAAGKRVQVGGNLGTPALELLDEEHAVNGKAAGGAVTTELYVLELSSFQLDTTRSLHAAAATILNITADHMDRYSSFEDYCKSKWHIYDGCKVAVVNRDDLLTYKSIEVGKAAVGASMSMQVISFGLQEAPTASDFGFVDGYLMYGKAQRLLSAKELKIKGRHQVANALAALALGHAIGLPFAAMVDALRSFPGLPHRCQWVRELHGVSWYNDSKGTNVGATQAAIEGLGAELVYQGPGGGGENSGGKLVLIAGGIGKDADFTALRDVVKKYVKTIVLIGKDAAIIEQALIGCCRMAHAASMHDAVALAATAAVAGDAVLLSPACASFDMFQNFEHRGEVFMEEVRRVG